MEEPSPPVTVSKPSGLVDRAKEILLQPTATWEKIATEPATIKGLFTSYVMILAAIPAVANLIGTSFVGVFGFTMPLPWGVGIAIIQYIGALLMVYVMGLVIDYFAPNFGAEKNKLQAFKVAAYCGTAAWLAGIFAVLPMLGVLGLLGLYSIYLLYRGLNVVMKAPKEKSTMYTVVVIIAMIVVGVIVGAVTAPLTMMARGGLGLGMLGAASSMDHPSGNVTIPGAGSVNLDKLQEASKKMEAAGNAIQSGKGIKVVDAEVLQGFLPPTIDGVAKSDIESQSGGAGGVNGSTAKATYALPEGTLTLSVSDMGSMGALTALGGAMNINSNKQTATGYEKISTQNGEMITESYDNASKHGEYALVVNTRIAISVEGNGVSMDKIKSVAGQIDKGKLASLAS